ncbi:MAG: hypothetical protein LUF90_05225 [Rikenellaceae bacterium]|nr:hypothetical protein [Rikenellaceae bacterium]
MKSVMITGAYPPDICGVGDYTFRLMNSSVAKNSGCTLYLSRKWSLFSFYSRVRDVKKMGVDVLFMQSPTKWYGWSIMPHLFAAYFSWFTKKKYIIMLHEYLQLSMKSRMATKIMLMSADHVIFSNDTDRLAAVKHFPRLNSRSSVIKIFSNIPRSGTLKPITERNIDIVNFGQIRPGRGILEYISVAEKLKKEHPKLRIALAGQVRPEYGKFYEEIKALCEEASIELHIDYDDQRTSELLNDCKIAYLPFPDGISERRGSFLAASYNGAIVVSNEGRFTTDELMRSVVIASKEDTDKIIMDILSFDKEELSKYQKKCVNFIFENMHSSWDSVMEKYIEVAQKCKK